MTYVLLVDRKTSAKDDIQKWLNRNGLVAWFANDVSHAIEELSDYTVHDRPDVVMLEVAFLADSFEALESMFNMSASEDEITVLGFAGEQSAAGRGFANDLHQLRMMISAKNSV
jgi:hypothetical protein